MTLSKHHEELHHGYPTEIVSPTPTKKKYKNKFLQVCSFILVMEMCERLAFYTFQTNLTIYIQKHLNYSSSQASMYSSLFTAIVYITPLFGAYVADAIWGRFKTILCFSCLYILGLYALAIAALPNVEVSWLFFISLFGFIALGAGGIKSNVVTLGADQFDPVTEYDAMNSFFNWFYWVINIGSLIATAYLSDFALNGGGIVSTVYSFATSFFIAAFFFTIALITFIMGSNRYHIVKPEGSAFVSFFQIVFYSARLSTKGICLLLGFFLLVSGVLMNILMVFIQNNSSSEWLTLLNGAIIFLGIIICIAFGKSVEWIHRAKEAGQWSTEAVDGAGELLRMLPYIGFMVSFWMVYVNLGGPWVNQGCQMDSRVFSSTTQYNPGSWAMWNSIGIIVFIPLFDKVLYPFVGRILKQKDGPTPLQKIGAGFLVAIFCMIVSGIIEIERKKRPTLQLTSVCDSSLDGTTARPVSDMSLWYQMPPYVLLGIAEILGSITAYDLFYNQVPDNMKSACQGLNLLTTALGSSANVMLQNIATSFNWLPNDLNQGHQEYFYFVTAVFGLLFFIIFLFYAPSFQYKNLPKHGLGKESPQLDVPSSFQQNMTV